MTLSTWPPRLSKHFCSCDRRDVLTHCNISLRILRIHTRFGDFGSSILARCVSYTLLFDVAPKEAVLYGQLRRAGAPSAPNTRRYTKFENQLACYAELPYWPSSCAMMYGTYVQTTQISMQALRTIPTQTRSSFRGHNLTRSFAWSCRTRPFPSELRHKDGTRTASSQHWWP
jgi:hypothetical protein